MRYLHFLTPKLPLYLVYMFQQVEYNPYKFLRWVVKTPNIKKVMHRQKIVWTMKAKVLAGIISLTWVFYLALTLFYLIFFPIVGIIVLLVSPLSVVLCSFLLVLFAWLYVEEPRRSTLLRKSTKLFAEHQGVKIAIAGSYGKTSMKELLNTVLSEDKNVAATPGNKNVPVSHASWVRQLTGEEEILLIEYGEGAPGDIKKLAKLTQPDYGIITGLAPNHLDEYKNLDEVAKDLLSLGNFVDKNKLYYNADSSEFSNYQTSDYKSYRSNGVMGWKIGDVKVDYDGTSFVMTKGKQKIKAKSGLLGEHQVGPLAFVAALSHELGLPIKSIEKGLAKTQPYEHRMQPRYMHGAWVIDDTYNGSLEGFKAGVALLKTLDAKRKIYVTPGLVDQGIETERVHLEIGELLGRANPDKIVLMQNSATQFIIKGLEEAEYKGDLQIEADPLNYYTNIDQVIAAGDLIIMQNDWTDNYS